MTTTELLFGATGLFIGLLISKSKDYTIIKKLNQIMATQAELAQQLQDITAQNEKSHAEILDKIADLEAALAAAGNTSPEVDAAVAALKASVQKDDDIVPDAPIEE